MLSHPLSSKGVSELAREGVGLFGPKSLKLPAETFRASAFVMENRKLK